MLIAAAAMIWYDWLLFLIVLGLAPVIWCINRQFHRRLAAAIVNAPIVQPSDGDARGIPRRRRSRCAGLFTARWKTAGVHGISGQSFTLQYSVPADARIVYSVLELNQPDLPGRAATCRWLCGFCPWGHDDVGDLVGFLHGRALLLTRLGLGQSIQSGTHSYGGRGTLFALLDTEPEWSDPPNAMAIGRIEGSIEFNRSRSASILKGPC